MNHPFQYKLSLVFFKLNLLRSFITISSLAGEFHNISTHCNWAEATVRAHQVNHRLSVRADNWQGDTTSLPLDNQLTLPIKAEEVGGSKTRKRHQNIVTWFQFHFDSKSSSLSTASEMVRDLYLADPCRHHSIIRLGGCQVVEVLGIIIINTLHQWPTNRNHWLFPGLKVRQQKASSAEPATLLNPEVDKDDISWHPEFD